MDTRSKIVNAEEARAIAAGGARVVTGYFDPMIAAHSARLQEVKGDAPKLLVLIATPPNAILPARARAELIASLAVVDYVCESADGIAPHVRLEEEDEARLEALIEHVHARQSAAG